MHLSKKHKDFGRAPTCLKRRVTKLGYTARRVTVFTAELCNGSTYDSDSYCWGSNPYSAAIEKADKLKCLSAFFYQKFISRLRASPPPFSTNPFQCQVYSLTKYYKIGIASLGGEWAARLRPAHSAHTSSVKFLKYPLFAFVLNRCLRAAREAVQNKFSK